MLYFGDIHYDSWVDLRYEDNEWILSKAVGTKHRVAPQLIGPGHYETRKKARGKKNKGSWKSLFCSL